jgi:hypothetical protein
MVATAMVVMVMDTATDTPVILKKRKPDLGGASGEFGVGGKGFGVNASRRLAVEKV